MKLKHKRILIGLFFAILIVCGSVWYVFTEKFADTSDIKANFSIDAIGFIKEFQQNDSLANKKYIEKIITITGTVSEIEMADSTANIKMSDTATGDYIIFSFQQQHLAEAKQIKKGSLVSLKGSCSGAVYSDLLETRYISFKRAVLNH